MELVVENYNGQQGEQSLVHALREMVLFKGSQPLAEEVAKHVEIVSSPKGTTLITEDEEGDSDMYFVLSGQLQVSINQREFALLGPGAHVGEFALIDPGRRRSATVRALQDSVTAKLSESAFEEIATRHQSLWRRVSQVLGNHLREGNRVIRRPHARPHVLVYTSQIGWPFAQAIKTHAADLNRETPAWLIEIRCAEEEETAEGIERAFAEADLGIIVIAPGDFEVYDGTDGIAGRDALFFQCGICLGMLGRDRTVIVEPADLGTESPAPSLNLSPLTYRLDPPQAIKFDVDAICRTLREKIQDLGSR